jgi:hypothetical protein
MRSRILVLFVGLAVTGCGDGCRRDDGSGRRSGAPRPDEVCLTALRKAGVAFDRSPPIQGVRTPIVVKGAIAGVRFVPRGRRPALMDCVLARAFVEAGPVLRALEVEALEFSAAYDHRPRRDSDTLSAHAHGLAIDVHTLQMRAQRLSIATEFEAGAGEWRRLRPGPGALAACIGKPKADTGRRLRTLVCRLKLHTSFRIIVTPDDNALHRDHLHLEVYPDETEPTG